MGNICSKREEIRNEIIKSIEINQTRLVIVHGDISKSVADVIVNDANTGLQHLTGTAHDILKRGGSTIQEESNRYVKENGPIPVEGIVPASPGKLTCKALLHAVGPIYFGGTQDEDKKLRRVVRAVLEFTNQKSYSSIAIPALSSGAYSYPEHECTQNILRAIKRFLNNHTNTSIKEIRLVSTAYTTAKCFQKFSEEKFVPLENENTGKSSKPPEFNFVRRSSVMTNTFKIH